MFRIGEFAQIAQVSGRQLRFYDQLGLLRPALIDHQSGYRYYTILQLPRLNSILALCRKIVGQFDEADIAEMRQRTEEEGCPHDTGDGFCTECRDALEGKVR